MNRCFANSILALGIACAGTALAQAKAPPPAAKGADKPLALLCQRQNRSKYLLVDYRRKTVNGATAVVTAAAVTWTSEEYDPARRRRLPTRHELDRIAGSYRFWPEGAAAEAAPPYGCDKAPPARF